MTWLRFTLPSFVSSTSRTCSRNAFTAVLFGGDVFRKTCCSRATPSGKLSQKTTLPLRQIVISVLPPPDIDEGEVSLQAFFLR